jgi:cytochrome c556
MRRRTHTKTICTPPFAALMAIFIGVLVAAQAQQQPQQSGSQQSGSQQSGGQQSGSQPSGGQPSGGQQGAAQPGAPQQGGAQPAVPQKALVPIAASTLVATPDAYYGEPVSLAGVVDQNLSRTAFSVDQDRTKSTGKDVLVLAPNLQRHVDPNTYVTVIGEVVKFDPAALGAKLKEYKLDLAPDVAVKYVGRPVVIATSVIDTAGNDVAKRLPPPMTAEEETYQKLMKQVGSSNGALRKAIEGSDAKLAAENSAVLKKTFADVETFWKGRRKNDAADWAEDARKLSENIERSVAAGRWDEVKAHAGTLGKACQACHGAYRERFDDGSFRIKKDGTS